MAVTCHLPTFSCFFVRPAGVTFDTFQTSFLPDATTEEVEFPAAHFGRANPFDFSNQRRVERKDSFHPDTRGNPPDGKGTGHAGAMLFGNHETFEDLNPFLAAFTNALVYAKGITNPERRERFAAEGGFDRGNQRVHSASGFRNVVPTFQSGSRQSPRRLVGSF